MRGRQVIDTKAAMMDQFSRLVNHGSQPDRQTDRRRAGTERSDLQGGAASVSE